MGASLALAGSGGCRRPEAHLVPFTKGAEWSIPGKFLYYATAMPSRWGAVPLVAATVDGRPTKIEGNPLHPSSNGGTDAFAQAAILELYDPRRSKAYLEGGRDVGAAAFAEFLVSAASRLGPGTAILSGRAQSPTRDRLRAEIERRFPGVLWAEYEPLGDSEERTAAEACFGPGTRILPKFGRADVVLAMDSDFLNPAERGPGYAVGFAARRNPDQRGAPMNRLYVAENNFTLTGGMADHRLRAKAGAMGELVRRLAVAVLAEKPDPSLASALGVFPSAEASLDDMWIAECARDLAANASRSILLTGPQTPASTQALVHAINAALGNLGTAILGCDDPSPPPASIGELVRAMESGSVKTLFILGGNPTFNAPADMDFAARLAEVPEVVRLGLFEDATSKLARWHVPAAHFLESWGDARSVDGTYSTVQPMILPLWGGMSEIQLLGGLLGLAPGDGPSLVRETFNALAPQGDRDALWSECLRAGFIPGSAFPQKDLLFSPASAAGLLEKAVPATDGLEIVFLQSASVDDGRFANNAWLLETPDPVTKIAWDNALLISPATAGRLGIGTQKSGEPTAEVVEISDGKKILSAAAVVAPGHADDSLSLALGFGQAGGGAIFENVGFDAYPLRYSASPRFTAGVTLRRTGETYPLALAQEHAAMEGRNLFREGTLETYLRDPSFAAKLGEEPHAPSLASRPPLTSEEQWGMAVDLTLCTGCNACVVACQAENNVPVVGKEQVRKNRDMAWIRIDRYFAGTAANPEMLSQPVMCQHCENAPCESVCPVNATVHSADGLNLMAYNRCIGTRYCANNCPWKVRRFNYFDYNERPLDQLYLGPLAKKGMPESLKLAKNPNVSVRSRGVMEKCTFCIQRIEEAKIARLVQAGASPKNLTPLPAFQVACQQACPSQALAFGNIADPASRASRLRGGGRSYTMLESLGASPRVTYLARIKNPNPKMPDAGSAGPANTPPEAR